MNGRLIYKVEDGYRLRQVTLTVCHEEDFKNTSLTEIRRKRIMRLLQEAIEQGCLLTYRDLNLILLSSPATLKRDISYLRKQGVSVFIKNGKQPIHAVNQDETAVCPAIKEAAG